MAFKTNLDVRDLTPSMEYKLPSAGIPYLAKYPDFPETVVIKPFSMATEAYLMGNATAVDKMQYITSAVAKFPNGFDLNDLLVSDEYLILAIARALTYGEKYSFRCQCPSCGYSSIEDVIVPDNLPVKVWSRDTPPKCEILLPVSKDMIEVKWLTIKDDREISKFIKQTESIGASGNVNNGWVRRTAYHLKSVNGGEPDNMMDAEAYMKRLPGPDVVAFNDLIEQNGCGIKYDWWIKCDKCSFLYDRSVPITSDFFRRNQVGRSDSNAEANQPASGS